MAKKDYHKPPEDPKTVGGGLKARGRDRRDALMTAIASAPRRAARNDLLPTMQLVNIALKGHVSKTHGEFVMASGEMTDTEFLAFNKDWMAAVLPHICQGGVLGTYIDWRGLTTVQVAASLVEITPLNVIVWVKTNAGMGGLYRSQHGFLPMSACSRN